jgi:hypothetical protein
LVFQELGASTAEILVDFSSITRLPDSLDLNERGADHHDDPNVVREICGQ